MNTKCRALKSVNENIDSDDSYQIQATAGRTGDMKGEGYLVTTKRGEKVCSFDPSEGDAENVGESTDGSV